MNGQGNITRKCAQNWCNGQWAASPKCSCPLRGVVPAALCALLSHCPPQPLPGLLPTCHHTPADTSQLSQEAFACVAAKYAIERGVRSMLKMSGMLPSGSSFAHLCRVPWKISDNDTDSPKHPLADFRYQIALEFFKTSHLGQSLTWTSLQPSQTIVLALRQEMGKQLSDQTQNKKGVRAGLGWLCQCQPSGQLCFFVLLRSPHIWAWGVVTLASLSDSVKPRNVLRPVPGKCCRNVKHPCGWPYHWERNLKSDPFVWLLESYRCIIHDSLLFFRRLKLLPSPLPPPYSIHNMNFIFWTKPHSPL